MGFCEETFDFVLTIFSKTSIDDLVNTV